MVLSHSYKEPIVEKGLFWRDYWYYLATGSSLLRLISLSLVKLILLFPTCNCLDNKVYKVSQVHFELSCLHRLSQLVSKKTWPPLLESSHGLNMSDWILDVLLYMSTWERLGWHRSYRSPFCLARKQSFLKSCLHWYFWFNSLIFLYGYTELLYQIWTIFFPMLHWNLIPNQGQLQCYSWI